MVNRRQPRPPRLSRGAGHPHDRNVLTNHAIATCRRFSSRPSDGLGTRGDRWSPRRGHLRIARLGRIWNPTARAGVDVRRNCRVMRGAAKRAQRGCGVVPGRIVHPGPIR